MTSAPPSGRQHEIGLGEQRATIAEVGATLRSYTVGDVDVVDGFDAGEMSAAGRGQVLAPWPNRLEDGVYSFDGTAGVAALDEPARSNAIHGLVRWLPWQQTSRADGGNAVVLACVLQPQPAYPWRLEMQIGYRLEPDGLVVTTTVTGRSGTAAPFGIGFHPYLTVGTPLIDDAQLTVPAHRRLVTDERGLPAGDERVAGTELDFTEPRAIGATRMDTAFTDLRRQSDGSAVVRLEHGSERRVELWMDPAFGHVMVYTGDTLDPAARRRRGIAIEPMTCPPNALRTGTDLIRLEPGSAWSARWGIRV